MTAPTVAQLVDQVADELGHLHGAVPTSTSAMIDQSVAGAREAAADAGLDLDDPAVAETVLRVSWAIGMAAVSYTI